MALIVEDGTGLPNANTYISIDFAVEFTRSVGFALTTDSSGNTLTTEDQETILILSASYMDAHYSFTGEKLVSSQKLKFPRTIDSLNVGVPIQVKEAQAYLCILQNTHGLINTNLGSHNTSNANNNRVVRSTRVKVGDIEEENQYSSINTIQNIAINTSSSSVVSNTEIGFGDMAEALLEPYLASFNQILRG